MTDKILYECEFNWYGEKTTLYRYSYNEKQARNLCFIFLAKKYDCSKVRIRSYFLHTDKYKILKILS